MAENKRFTLDDENDDIIFDNNSITNSGIKELYWLIDYDQRQKLVDLLNELSEENKELKKEVNEWTQKYVDEMESHACTYRELDSIKQTLDDWKLDFDNVKETVRNGQGRVIGIYYYI